MRRHIWCSTEDGPRCAACDLPKTPATANMFCSGMPDVPPPAEEADPAWLTWHPAPLTPEQHSLLCSAMQGLLWAVVPAIALKPIQLVHVHAVGVFPVSDAVRFWLLTHEYVRLSIPDDYDDGLVPTTAAGWRLLVLSEAGEDALKQAARQGGGVGDG